jgi:hypothetical protein
MFSKIIAIELSFKFLICVIHIKVVATDVLDTLQLTSETIANASTGFSHVVNNQRLDWYQETKLQLPIIIIFTNVFKNNCNYKILM